MRASPFLRRGSAPLLVLLAAATLGGITAAYGDGARAEPPASPPARSAIGSPPIESSWRTVVDGEHRFALRLPPSHDVARSGTIWYVHGRLEGEPLVPDLSITLAAGHSANELVGRDFPPSTRVTPVEMGPATSGLRVTARFEHPDGTPYESISYLVETDAGTFRIDRYESFDWPFFEPVARSFHVVSFTHPWPPSGGEGRDWTGASPEGTP